MWNELCMNYKSYSSNLPFFGISQYTKIAAHFFLGKPLLKIGKDSGGEGVWNLVKATLARI